MEAYDTFYRNIFIFKNPGIEKLWGPLFAACKVLKSMAYKDSVQNVTTCSKMRLGVNKKLNTIVEMNYSLCTQTLIFTAIDSYKI